MDLNHVSTFARVVVDGSFTAAARSLGLPKSSVSRSVAQLEEDLGIRLLQRTTRKLHLTDAGAAFYERVARALGDITDATSVASESQESLKGTVRLTAPVDFGVWALAPMLSRFVRKHPEVKVDLVLTGRMVDLVGERIDLAVRAGKLRDSSLIAKRIGDLRSVIYASPKYLGRRGEPKTIEDLASHDCVLFRPTNGRDTWALKNQAGEEREIEVSGALGADDLSFVRKATMSGAGLGLLPEFLCGRAEASGLLVRVLRDWEFSGAILHLAYPSARFVPQRVVVLREFLTRELGKMSAVCDRRREIVAPKR
ncbi:MAG: LysR family transcriptional regulator [Deltaproteobacteria bacterium]|nr:LysR family transcriptional regulator [Deltaproteobacteria bacterium]